jgi:hypothetical protein
MDSFGINRNRGVTMSTGVARGALVSLVLLSIACGGSTPSAPTPTSQSTAVPSPTPPPPLNVPPLSGPSRTFTFDHDLAHPLSDYTTKSRFALYDNGGFALEYVSLGIEYHGRYTESNGVITFQWEGWSIAGAWAATGTLNNGALTVQYNSIMRLSDFEDAVYRLTQ